MDQSQIVSSQSVSTLPQSQRTDQNLNAALERLNSNMVTLADRMRNIVRSLRENYVDTMETPSRPGPTSVKVIRKLKWAKAKGEDCLICHEPMERKCKKLPCKHEFHAECIIPWLKITSTCPVCRKVVGEPCNNS